ncbi:flagellar biosynthesis anti-sigma factor FlgM [Spirochaetia bacterium 38H-sp]|uniref:Flagellar biosynthesis anti-sigma factor FlgM n=1 Tax=Rarispira pelagica TaxID=3141764 RepID=A0ABU9UA81_9SPIR
MTIDRTGPIDPINKYLKTQKTERVVKKSEGDSVSISQEAVRRAEFHKAVETVKATPDIRMDRVEEVKKKLEDPSYIDDTVIDVVADRILDVFGIE